MSGRRKKHGHEEHHVDERWLVSYADMITVLMALFIVMYAMSTVDQKKFDELKNSLATGFGVTQTSKTLDENTAIVPKQFVAKDGAGFSNSTIAVMQVAKEIQNELKAAGLTGKVKVANGSNSITISLVGSSAYFEGNEADLSTSAVRVLRKLAPTLEKHAGTVTVEGHADPRGSAGRWGDDWNLASARANSVRQWLTAHDSVDPAHVSVVSFGSERAKKGHGAAVVEHNRRVDIVLRSVVVPTAPAPAAEKEESTTGHGSAGGHGDSKESTGRGESAKPTTGHAAEPAKAAEGHAAEPAKAADGHAAESAKPAAGASGHGAAEEKAEEPAGHAESSGH